MKRIRNIIVILTLFLLSGCSIEYNLTINSDFSVNEKVVAKENTNRMKNNTGLKEENAVTYLYDIYKRDGYKTSISTISSEGNTISTVMGSYKTLDDYVDNFSTDIVNEANLTKKGNIVTLTFEQDDVLSSSDSRGLIYDEITVNIKLPFKVISNNADSHKKDVYTWNIKKDEKPKKIIISYDETINKTKKTFNIGAFKFSVRTEIIAITTLFLIAGFIAIVVYRNNKKNNKM